MQIVAPAGSFSALRAAVKAGADAVYLGLPQYGARAKAENFTAETFPKAVEYAHLFGTKVFVTLNTLIKDDEMDGAIELARFAYDNGADAAIVQDIRFIEELNRRVPKLTLHASTQMGIHNAYGAEVLKDLGIKRAVLARETLPCDIEKIKQTGLEIEYFVQGALCVCFSGNCYFSSLASSYSGNRGKCMQLCRKPYLFHGKNGYFLSAKDLCLYGDLSKLSDLGVDAIKIEGRMRSDEYVYRAVRVYKSRMSEKSAKDALKAVFNRGDYCNAYLDDNAQFRVVYPKFQANIGKSIGKIKRNGKYISVKGYVPHDGDGYKVMRNGADLGGARTIDGKIVSDCSVKDGDELRLTFDGRTSEELKKADRKINVTVRVKIAPDAPACVSVSANNAFIEITSDVNVQHAKTSGLSRDDVTRAFEKTGDYPFCTSIETDIADNSFMPISALNELRRKAYNEIYNKLLSNYARCKSEAVYRGLRYNKLNAEGTILMVERLDAITPEILSEVDYIALNPRDYGSVGSMRTDIKKPILLNLPVVMRGDDEAIIKSAVNSDIIYGVISNNLYSLKITDKPILLGTGHNIIGKCELPHIKSFEADRFDDGFVYVFGYAPLMTLCHCIYGKCINCSGSDKIADDCGRSFELRRFNCAHCYWQYLNCVPHNLTSDKRIKNKFYDCTAVPNSDILGILRGEYHGNYTRGNVNKGLK